MWLISQSICEIHLGNPLPRLTSNVLCLWRSQHQLSHRPGNQFLLTLTVHWLLTYCKNWRSARTAAHWQWHRLIAVLLATAATAAAATSHNTVSRCGDWCKMWWVLVLYSSCCCFDVTRAALSRCRYSRLLYLTDSSLEVNVTPSRNPNRRRLGLKSCFKWFVLYLFTFLIFISATASDRITRISLSLVITKSPRTLSQYEQSLVSQTDS